MALPKLPRPEYTTTIPSTGRRVKYHPFSVREEKVLIIAAQSQDLDEVSNAIANVLSRCVTSPSDFDPRKLALFDIEYLFLKTRAKSVGETIKIIATDPDDDTCNLDHEIPIDSIKIDRNPEHVDLIDIDEKTKVKMSYPGLDFFAEGVKLDTITESSETAAKCVSQIVIEDKVHQAQDLTEKEIVDWIDDLTTAQYAKIIEFFLTMPRLRHVIKRKNPNTGETFELVLEGLSDFF